MPWDSVDKWRDEDFWPPRGRRKRERTDDSTEVGLQGVSQHGVQPDEGCDSDGPMEKDGEEVQ